MSNPQKLRPYCANGCGRRIKRQRAAYCSQRCQVDRYHNRLIAQWRAGELPPRHYFNRIVRRHIIEAAGEQCEYCGWRERNPFTGRIPLEIEHVDGNWKNNLPPNIRVLCPNCHALTATFRGANRGRGRPGRPGLTSATVAAPRRRRFRWTDAVADRPLFSTFPGDLVGSGNPGAFRRYHVRT